MNNNYVLVKIEGKNVGNYVKWLIKNKINIINLNIVKHNELKILIDYKNFNLLSKYSKTYKITIIRKYGKLRLFDILKNNIIIILCLMLSIIFLYFLSNIILSVDVIYNDSEVVDLIKKELAKYDIKKYEKKKSYEYLDKVKERILNDNKDTLEWLEIEESGTKYIVRLVERKKETKQNEYQYQSVVASKDATIASIKAYSGEKVKQVNEYVKKGDVIISGILTKPDGTNLYTKAKGSVLGEVWYKVSVEYPLYYKEERVTGKNKSVILICFLNKEIPIFPYKKYKQFKRQSRSLIENNFIPFKITKEKLYEVIIKEDIYTNEEAIQKAIEEAKLKIKEKNKNIINIKNVQMLDKENLNSKIKINLFVSVIEDITEITEVKEKTKEENIDN